LTIGRSVEPFAFSATSARTGPWRSTIPTIGTHACIAAHRTPYAALTPSAVIGFIHLDTRPRTAKRHIFGHQGANLFEHSPRRFICHAQFPLNLFRGNAAARCGHEIEGIEPKPQRCAGLLKDRPSHRSNHGSAVVAGVHLPLREAIELPLDVAVGAERLISRIPLRQKPVKAGIIGWKHAVKLLDCKAHFLRNRLLNFYGKNSMRLFLPAVKGYLPYIISLAACWQRPILSVLDQRNAFICRSASKCAEVCTDD
jgi:hypothetical protein